MLGLRRLNTGEWNKPPVLTVAIAIIMRQLCILYGGAKVKDAAVIHNGQGLKKVDRDEIGKYAVYAAGGRVGNHSERLTEEPFVVIGRKGSAGKPTYAPDGGWVIDTAYYAQPRRDDLSCKFLYYALEACDFSLDVIATAIPGINRTAIYEHKVPLPPRTIQVSCIEFLDALAGIRDLPQLPEELSEQRRIIAKIEELAAKIEDANKLKIEIDRTSRQLLQSAFVQITRSAKFMSMSEVSPITRRPVSVDLFSAYPELGIRSFGNGTFHKPALSGAAVGNKRLFRIEPGDLIFHNVFAWEGAVAVVKAEDSGRFGSHRFITCVPQKDLITPEFLHFYFLTNTNALSNVT